MTEAGVDSRHRRLHGARAGARQGGRQACRHLGVRGRALRDADRAASLRWRGRGGHARTCARARCRLRPYCRRPFRQLCGGRSSSVSRRICAGALPTSATSSSRSAWIFEEPGRTSCRQQPGAHRMASRAAARGGARRGRRRRGSRGVERSPKPAAQARDAVRPRVARGAPARGGTPRDGSRSRRQRAALRRPRWPAPSRHGDARGPRDWGQRRFAVCADVFARWPIDCLPIADRPDPSASRGRRPGSACSGARAPRPGRAPLGARRHNTLQ